MTTNLYEQHDGSVPDGWPPCWARLLRVLRAPLTCAGAARILIYGPPATGKTYAVHAYAQAAHARLYSLTITEDQPADPMLAFWRPDAQGFSLQRGPLAQAWADSHQGPPVVVGLHELDHASPEVVTLLSAVLDDPEIARITLPDGTEIRPAPANVRYIATMNGSMSDLRPALLSRLPVRIEIPSVHPEAVDTLPQILRAALLGFGDADGNADWPISFRECAALAALLAAKIPIEDAVAVTLGPGGKALVESLMAAGEVL